MVKAPFSGHPVWPAPRTSLVGREREVAQVRDILNWPQVALLTLTGPGGVGKTRLALEVVRSLAAQYQDGVVFVPLASVQRPEHVVSTLAQALELQESVRPTLEVLLEHLRGRELLLVLDNFEHVLEAAPAVSALLEGAPGLTVLVTSRACLRLYGEHEFPVPPLSLPMGTEPGEAVRLFTERVRAVQPGFALTPEVLRDAGEVCRRLDGLPLAIELAAARVRLLPLPALLGRLDHRLRLLEGGARDLPDRQRTLRATLDWSFDLLEPLEQALFARLGVFVGGWSWEAASAVCGESGDLDVLDALSSLVEKSLVQRSDADGEARFGLLETLREYALEKLSERGELAALRGRHARYFAGWSREAQRGLQGHGQLEALARVEREQPNVLAALRERAEAGDPAGVSVFAWHLGWAWAVRVDDRAEHALDEAMQLAPPQGVARARLLHAQAWLLFRRGHFARAVGAASECLNLFQAAGDAEGAAYAGTVLGMTLLPYPERSAEGVALCEAAQAAAGTLGLPWLEALANSVLGWQHLMGNRPDEAHVALRAVQRFGTASGEHNLMSWNRLGLAGWHVRRGEAGEAAQLLHEGLTSAQRMNDPAVMAACLHGFAAVAALRGQDLRAAQLLGAAGGLRAARNIAPQTEQALFGPAINDAQARLGHPAFEAGQEEGSLWLLDTALELALSAEAAGPTDAPAPVPMPAPHTTPAPLSRLTASEREVLSLLAQGLSNKQIAAQRGTGVYTVSDQVKAVFGKLGVNSRAAATRTALEQGLG